MNGVRQTRLVAAREIRERGRSARLPRIARR